MSKILRPSFANAWSDCLIGLQIDGFIALILSFDANIGFTVFILGVHGFTVLFEEVLTSIDRFSRNLNLQNNSNIVEIIHSSIHFLLRLNTI